MRLSLQEMQPELAQLHLAPLALRKLNQRLHQVAATPGTTAPTTVPLVLQEDAIWVQK